MSVIEWNASARAEREGVRAGTPGQLSPMSGTPRYSEACGDIRYLTVK